MSGPTTPSLPFAAFHAPSSSTAPTVHAAQHTDLTTRAAPAPAPLALNVADLDLLPALHALLSHLEPETSIYTRDPDNPSALGGTKRGGPSSGSGPASVTVQGTAAAGVGTDAVEGKAQSGARYQDFAAAAAGDLKARIRRTLAQVEGLEDVQRSVAQQEAEMKALKSRIEGQREVLRRLGAEARVGA